LFGFDVSTNVSLSRFFGKHLRIKKRRAALFASGGDKKGTGGSARFRPSRHPSVEGRKQGMQGTLFLHGM